MKTDAAEPADKAVEATLLWGISILLKDQGHFLGKWLGQILDLSAERAAISDSDGIGLRQVPHDEMMPDAAAALEGFLESNPMLAPLVPVQPDHRARPTRRGQDAHGRSSSAATMNVK